MGSLVPVNGNTAEELFEMVDGWSSSNNYEKKFEGCTKLKISNIPGKVAIINSPNKTTGVLVDADQEFINDLTVRLDPRGMLIISGKSKSDNISVVSVSGNSISITGGGIYIDGGRVNTSSQKKEKEVRMVIFLPEKTPIIAKSYVSQLLIARIGGSVKLDLAGQSKIEVQDAVNLNADLAGQSKVNLFNIAGKVDLNTSGQSGIVLNGNMDNVTVDLSGQSSTIINGVIQNDLSIDASGQSTIISNARVFGDIEKDSSGMSNIIIN